MLDEGTTVDAFASFVEDIEPKLRLSLCSAYGREVGLDATADALAYGWEHWDRVRTMEHPAAYLWQVGRNRARRIRTRKRLFFESIQLDHAPWVEPGLPSALGRLSERQRVAVMLIYGFEWTFAEVSELLGVSRSTIQKHTERAMDHLRRELGVDE